ncbi:NepR family anti-sigma factor [Yoonia sp. BS5-3]|uniref:NepR family anti-sigma factor n=1 Tax=Yoonia phaeophyticola TaxID=3137369 RepID=A0ABZ2V1X4_9RHOB
MDEKEKPNTGILSAHLKDAYSDTLEEELPETFRLLIDENLRKGVEETLNEGIPDRFRHLLSQLDEVASKGGDS